MHLVDSFRFLLLYVAKDVSSPPKTMLDDVLLTSGLHIESKVPRSCLIKVNQLQVIFDINVIIMVKQAIGSRMQPIPPFHLGLD